MTDPEFLPKSSFLTYPHKKSLLQLTEERKGLVRPMWKESEWNVEHIQKNRISKQLFL